MIAHSVDFCGSLNLMDLHGTHSPAASKEIQCADCGQRYRAALQWRSARCPQCGNIEFFPVQESGGLAPEEEAAAELQRFRGTPSGHEVERLLIRHQVEWQLWAAVVKNFSDPAHHSAYLSLALSFHCLDQAAARYREHQAVMALLPDSRWQAEVAEVMLGRLESLSAVQMQREASGLRLPSWVLLLPVESRTLRVGWILLGLAGGARLFGLV